MVQQGAYKAVIFDMGGVILRYTNVGQFVEMVNSVEKYPVLAKAMERLDVGELSMEDAPKIAKECIEAEPDTKKVFEIFKAKEFSKHLTTCPHFASAVEKMRLAGLQTALLTNNFFMDAEKTKSTILPNADAQFDVVIESCRTGLRKPNAAIYELTLERLGRNAEECIFVDDLAKNCEAAEALGIRSVQVAAGNARGAVEELQALLGINLLD